MTQPSVLGDAGLQIPETIVRCQNGGTAISKGMLCVLMHDAGLTPDQGVQGGSWSVVERASTALTANAVRYLAFGRYCIATEDVAADAFGRFKFRGVLRNDEALIDGAGANADPEIYDGLVAQVGEDYLHVDNDAASVAFSKVVGLVVALSAQSANALSSGYVIDFNGIEGHGVRSA